MKTSLLTLTAAAFIVAGSIGPAQAQQGTGGQMMHQAEQGQGMMQHRPGMRESGQYRGRHAGMRGHRMMHHGMRHGAMMRIMFALIDADGDGALSREEVQEALDRIFNQIDADGDGRLTMEEIRTFYRAARAPGEMDQPEEPAEPAE
jgi:hypothetical protein